MNTPKGYKPMSQLPENGETIALVKTGKPADMIVAEYEYVDTVGEPYLRILNGSQMFWPEKESDTYIGWFSLIEPPVQAEWKDWGYNHHGIKIGIFHLEVWVSHGWKWDLSINIPKRKRYSIAHNDKYESSAEAKTACIAAYKEIRKSMKPIEVK